MPSINESADYLIRKLKERGIIVQRYNAQTTKSVYLKLDYGVCNSIRISDHPGKKHLHYRFNLIEGIDSYYVDKHSRYQRHFYPFRKIDKMIADILEHRQTRIDRYGTSKYFYLVKQSKKDNSGKAGFWRNAFKV